MKIVLIADVHGNSIALNAVLKDAKSNRPDMYLFLGDLVDGHDPSGVIEIVARLSNAKSIVGNTDRYIMTGIGPPPLTLENVKGNPELIDKFREASASFAWAKGHLVATGWYDSVCNLPVEHRIELPGGQHLLAVHSSPGYADGPGIAPYTTDTELSELIGSCTADVICVGHTHIAFSRKLDHFQIINPGSVSNPLAPDLRASYAILTARVDGLDVKHIKVEYDHSAVIDAIRRSHHPAADFIIGHQLGKFNIEDLKKAARARRYMIKSPKSK